MASFGKLGFKAKLIIVLLVPVMMTGIVGYMGVNNMARVNAMLEEIYSNNLITITYISEADMFFIQYNSTLSETLREIDSSVIEKNESLLDNYASRMNELIDKYRGTSLPEKEKQLLKKINTIWKSYKSSVDSSLSALAAGNNLIAMGLLYGDINSSYKVLNDLFSDLIKMNQDRGKEKYKESISVYFQQRTVVLCLVLFSMLGSPR